MCYTRSIYNAWALHYDEDMRKCHYRAPRMLVEFVEGLGLPKTCSILDVGCGTGLLGEAFANAGTSLEMLHLTF